MGCSYKLHIRTDDITDKHMEDFFCNHLGHPLHVWGDYDKPEDYWKPINKTPSLYMGEHSFLKAALFDDHQFLSELINIEDIIKDETGYGEPITDELLAKLKQFAKDFEEKTNQSYYCRETDIDEIIEFLTLHKGKRCFFVCW